MPSRQKRIGIFSGTFDPVHAGHITFALQALQERKLDKIYFIPERQPRYKKGTEHFGHRVAMLRRALLPHPQFEVLEMVDTSLSVVRSLPKLQQKFKGSELVFLFGSDVASSLPVWPDSERLLKNQEIIIGLRKQDTRQATERLIRSWHVQPKRYCIVHSYAPHISSSKVREALYRREPVTGLLRSVQRYSDHNWLYVSVA